MVKIERTDPNPSLEELHRQWWWDDIEYRAACSPYQWSYFRKENKHNLLRTILCMRDVDILIRTRDGQWRIAN